MPDSKVSKTYVRPDNTALLTCSHCGQQKVILADSFKGHKHKLKVKCLCQNTFIVNLEFRKSFRMKTKLTGTYINHSRGDSGVSLLIHDISLTGLAFTNVNVKKIKIGDELTIEFTLDDEHKTKIRKDIIVRNVYQGSVGCEYERSEAVYEGPLGRYIMSNL
jgi:hypothetical protein